MEEIFYENDDYKIVCDTPYQANELLLKVKEIREEFARIDAIAVEKIAEINAKRETLKEEYDRKAGYYEMALKNYLDTVDAKETKTQKSYKLFDGNLVYKKPTVKYERDEKAFTEWLKGNGYKEFVETVEKPKWADFKAQTVTTDDGLVIDGATGEIVDGITYTMTDGKFEVK